MFIKLTRRDNAPIWINAAFVVTVEPRQDGGSVVVPVGDGLDYDVRESPETVLALLGDAPVPAILPVPTTDALTPTPEDVSPESDAQSAGPAEVKPEKPVRKAAAKKPRVSRKKKPPLPLAAEQVERLKKMAPRSVKKLQNTLQTQFKVEDAEGAVKALEANGVFALDRDHVVWADTTEEKGEQS